MKKRSFIFRTGLVALLAAAVFPMTSCSDDDTENVNPTPAIITDNKAVFIKDSEKLASIYSMQDIDGNGRLYEMNYTADYKLDEALQANISSTAGLLGFVQRYLYDSIPQTASASKVSFTPGCSAFAVPEATSGNFLMGRNYDFCHTTTVNGVKQYVPISAFVVHTAPKGGKKSISFVDGLNFGYKQGACTDGKSDLSLLIGLPYAALDGINEDGFAISVLSLNEAPAMQTDATKKNICTTVAIRMLLDRASTVKQAVEMLRQYNMRMKNTDDKHNYHFFMADATGDYAIVEYTRNPKDTLEKYPTRMEVLTGNDTLRCVTNFYVSPTMAGTNDGWGSDHGKKRYFDMRDNLLANNYVLSSSAAMSLLKLVSQEPNEDDPTSFTQWSEVFNLTEKSLRLSILREYGKSYNFKVE